MVAWSLPRVMFADSGYLRSLDHPFPIVSMLSHLVQINDYVALRVDDIHFGIAGKVISLNGGTFLNRDLLETEFLLQVKFINPQIQSLRVPVVHPNGMHLSYSMIPLGKSYIFLMHQISYISDDVMFFPVFPALVLQRNGFQQLQLSA